MSACIKSKSLALTAVCLFFGAGIGRPMQAWGASLPIGTAPVVVNEILASNGHTLADPQGRYDDWIELYNWGNAAVDLAGMYLTDDLAEPTKWQFPKNSATLTTIAPHGYLLVWADGQVAETGLHAGFSLSAGGESVGLVDRDGMTVLDSVNYGPQRTDISFGRLPDGGGAWSLMPTPTPRAANFCNYQGFVDKPQFSVRHGFYTSEIQVSITCPTPGAAISYTIDGSTPMGLGDGARPGSVVGNYVGPIRISKTTCLRARAGKTGWYPSATETCTYLFPADIIAQSPTGARPGPAWPSGSVNGQIIDYGMDPDVVNDPRYKGLIDDALLALPSISLVTDVANLFDPQIGIYVHARSQGQAWERPVSVELLYPDGTEGFQIDAGLRIRGGYSRSSSNPKHAFRLFFGPEYGPATLQYPLFGTEGVDEFECVDLRTSQNYSWSYEGGNSNSHDTFVREVFSRDTQRDMGEPYTRSRYYHLYLNGQYWGLYETQERAEASYAASYFGGDKEDYDVIKSRAGNGGYDIEATDGTLDNWRVLWNAAASGFASDATYYRVQGLNPDRTVNPAYPKLLDVDNLIDYMLCTYYVGDPDGPVSAWGVCANNFYGICARLVPEGFRFFRHDAEHSLDDLYESRLFAPTTVAVGASFNQSNPLWMHTHLMAHPEYRLRFADRVYRHFFNDGVLTPQACINRFSARMHQIETAIIAESARWGDSKRVKPRTKDDDWVPDMNKMLSTYFPARTALVFNQFKGQGWWPSVEPPALNTHGGHVAAGFSLQMTSSSGTIYYTLDGTDPRVPGKAGSASVSAKALRYTSPVTLSRSTTVKARVLSGTTWSALNEATFAVGPVAQSLRVSELMYHPQETGNPNDPNTEFIELTNIAGQSINLNLVRFTRGIEYTFPSYDLAPGGYCLVVKDLAAFQAKYGTKLPVVGPYAGSFSNAGEYVELVDAAGTLIEAFTYADAWYKSTDGQGYSLTVKNPKTATVGSLNDKNAWQASAQKGGSPGRAGP